MTTLNLTQRQLKWAEKLVKYNFKVTYEEGKKNPADGLLRQPNYELLKTASTSTAAEIVQQSFCLRSQNYKSVQEELYTLTAITLQLRHSVQQELQQENVVSVIMNTISMMNTEDGSFIETSAVQNLPAQEEVSYNELQLRCQVQQGLQQKNVIPVTTNTISTMNTEDDDLTEISAVWNLPAQEASCVMSEVSGSCRAGHADMVMRRH